MLFEKKEFQKKLSLNGVLYINIDNIIKGRTQFLNNFFKIRKITLFLTQKGNYSLKIKASPLTFDVVYNVSKLVQFNETHTLFDTWLDNEPNALKTMPK
jgi:hypothetical protein